MGCEVIAKCKCGYTKNVPIGGGMQNFQTTCYFPALCKTCAKVVTVNLLKKKIACPKCRSTQVVAYNQPELVKVEGPNRVAEWDELYLTDGSYYCPKCKKFTLSFEDGGVMWD